MRMHNAEFSLKQRRRQRYVITHSKWYYSIYYIMHINNNSAPAVICVKTFWHTGSYILSTARAHNDEMNLKKRIERRHRRVLAIAAVRARISKRGLKDTSRNLSTSRLAAGESQKEDWKHGMPSITLSSESPSNLKKRIESKAQGPA